MPTTPVPPDPSQRALRSLVWRVVVACIAGIAVIAAFVVAWRLGAFRPPAAERRNVD